MQLSFRSRDAITPALAKAIRQFDDTTPFLEAMGQIVVSQGQRAFDESALRPAPWPARKGGGSHPLLKLSGTLWRSVRITSLTSQSVTVGSDRIYAAIHQLGGTIRPKNAAALRFKIGSQWVQKQQVKIPARPYLPFTPAGNLTDTGAREVEESLHRKVLLALG